MTKHCSDDLDPTSGADRSSDATSLVPTQGFVTDVYVYMYIFDTHVYTSIDVYIYIYLYNYT